MMKKYAMPPGYTFLQSIVRTYKQVKNPIGTMEESMSRFDGTYAVNLGLKRMIVTQDPGFIEHVLRVNHKNYYKSPIQTDQLGKFLGKGLLTSNGEYWLKQRRLIQPGFHMDKIHKLYAIIKNTGDEFLKRIPTGSHIDVYPLMYQLAFEIVINSLFNIKVPAEDQRKLSDFIKKVQEFVIKEVRQPHKNWWFSISGEVKRNLDRANGARQIIFNIIQERKNSDQRFDDLLDMLLDARYEDNGQPMHVDQVIDEILILLIAGHETTANALAWSLYLLATHSDELKELKTSSANLTVMECVANDELNAVIKESMRLFPPAWISDRVALDDDQYKNFSFPKGSIIILFYYGLHRDKKYWADPDSFQPSRFFKGNSDKEKIKAFYPFGAGPRLCIGNNFAMAEMAIFLQSFIQQFDFKPTGFTPKINPLVTLRPDRIVLEVEQIQEFSRRGTNFNRN
jgi:cytochrome P450